MMRGSPLVVVTMPWFWLVSCTFGLPQFVWLNTLKDSIRSSTRRPLAMLMLRENARSEFQNEGPRRYPLGTFPHEPAGFCANAAMLNHCSCVGVTHVRADAARFGSIPGTMIGRWLFRPVSAVFPVVDGVSGWPLRAWTIRPSCQLRVTTLRMPWPSPGLMSTVERLKMCGRSASHGPWFVETSGCGFV